MLLALGFANDWDFWNLNHKVTFDGVNKVICVNDDVTELDIKIDVYSDWKEWKQLQDYGKYLAALRTIGGDPTIAPQTAGDIYFTINGWQLAIDLTKVAVTGVLFSDNFDSAYINKADWLATQTRVNVFPASVSNLVTGIDEEYGGASASEIRTELTPELSLIDVSISSRASQTSVDALSAVVDTINTTTTSIESKVDLIQLDITNILSVVDDIIKHHHNRTFIDENNFTLTVYENDGVTPHRVFDLKDENGVASITRIFERVPQAGSP